MVHGPPVIHDGSPGGQQTVSKDKIIAKIISDSERMKNIPVHICAKLPSLFDLQLKEAK
jgi:hypothetical protein